MNSSSESGQKRSPSSHSSKSRIKKELTNKKRKRKTEKSQKNIGSTGKKDEKRQKKKEYDKKQIRQNIKDKTFEKENIIELKEKDEKKNIRKEDKKKMAEMTKDSSGSNDERKVHAGKSLKNSPENEKEESVQKALEDMKELFDKKFKEFSEQLNKKMNDKDVKINDLNQKVEELEKEVKEQRVKVDLINEINNQTEIYNNINNKVLNSKINALINSFKILFIRKLSNLLFQKIVEKYKNDLAKTEEIFGQEPHFGIIVAKNDINNISKYQINILFDYLKYIKQFSSRIIHMRDFYKIYCQKEIFYELLNIYSGNKTEKKKETVDTNDIINIIFKQKDVKSDEGASTQKETQLEKLIKEYIYKENDKENQLDQNEKEKEKKEDNKKVKKEEREEENELEEDDSCESFNEEKLQNIMSGEKSEKSLKVVDLLKKLKKKIKINQNNNKIKILKNTEINPKFIFGEWKNSFDSLPYKKSEQFQSFVDIQNYDISLKKMANIIKELLPQEKFKFFAKDPDNFENLIENVIEKY